MSVMNQRPEKEVFEEVALLKSIDPSFVEKDWYQNIRSWILEKRENNI